MLNFKEVFDKIFAYKKAEKEKRRKKLIKILTIFFICLFFLIIICTPIFAYELIYKDKIYQGVYINGLNMGGLTQSQATNKINEHLDNLKQNGLNFYYQGSRLKVDFNIISPTDPDLSYQILNFETNQLVDQAFKVGRQRDFIEKISAQINALLNQPQIALIYELNENDLKDILKQNFSKFENPGQDAQIVFSPDGTYKIEKELSGEVIDYDLAIATFKKQINLISINSVELKKVPILPQVTQQEAQQAVSFLNEILLQEKIVLIYKDKKWEILKDEFKNWLIFKKENNQIKIGFKEDLLNQKLQTIAQEINVLP